MIPEVNPFNNYKGDGLATRFDYDFMIENASQLIVQKISENDAITTLINNVDYEIKEIGNNNGGYIIFPIANSEHSVLGENESISLQLTLPFEQVSEYGQSSLLNLNSLELSLDYLTRLCQILKRQMERSVKANEGNDIIDIALPPPKANNTFAWNEDASALVNYDIIGENNAFKNNIVDSLDAAKNEFNTIIATNKEEMLDIQENFEQENNAKFEAYQDELNTKFETVADAADRINNLDNDLAIATNAANVATEQATNVEKTADEILNIKDEFEANIDNLLNTSNITNCITSIPQRIKLDLNNGTLTLKAGSVVTVPNGFEDDGATPKFDKVEISDDIVCASYTTAASRYLLYQNNTVYGAVVGYTQSGDSSIMDSITPDAYRFFYNTQTNKIYRGDGTSWVESSFSLPLGIAVNNSSSQYTSIEQIFNGIGQIGSIAWVDEGITALSANGRNEDGTLNNKSYTTESIKLIDYKPWDDLTNAVEGYILRIVCPEMDRDMWALQPFYRFASDIKSAPTGSSYYAYVEPENQWYTTDGTNWYKADVYLYATKKTKEGYFRAKTTFRALDYNDKGEIASFGLPSNKNVNLTLGASGSTYTAPANGYVFFRRTATAAGQSFQLLNATSGAIQLFMQAATTSLIGGYIPVKRNDKFSLTYTLGSSTNEAFIFTYAEGEQ